jgi:tRNA-uridine 2-sulfurtransferase
VGIKKGCFKMAKKKVLLGMSGGVDSSVAVQVLLDQGYEVLGVTLKLWDGEKDSSTTKTCCSIDDVEDARRVAFDMGIDHYVLNMKDLFREKVVDYFVDEYVKGRTPNPCIACNKHMKFSAMLRKAEMLGCDYVSTGHFARIEYDEVKGAYQLKRGVDLKKDQSYVLYHLNQKTLSKVLLPLGGMTKEEVRAKADEMGLLVSKKPDSQEICFVNSDYVSFIKDYSGFTPKLGEVVNTKGEILGRHEGIINYTVGQRKGIGLSGGPKLYVKELDSLQNKVVVAEHRDMFVSTLQVQNLNFVSVDKIESGTRVDTKIRYNAKLEPSVIHIDGDNMARITFDKPQRAITPGQAVVFYDGDVVLGGGTIG